MERAQAQDYHPRYGLGAQSVNSDLSSTLGSNTGPAQLQGAVSNGFLPEADVDYSTYHPGAASKNCLAILAAGGQTFNNQNAEAGGLAVCDGILFIKAAGDKMGKSLTQASFMAGVNALGSTFTSPQSLGEIFSPAQHDGGSQMQTMTYAKACNCFRYIGAPFVVAPGG